MSSDVRTAADGSAIISCSNTTLYLFTFLITIVVLGLITALLLLRAYYVRRAFHRRIEEAIRSGRPLPPEAFPSLRTNRRGKKEKQHGPMPSMWEAEMWRNGHEWMTEKDAQKDWQSLTVSDFVSHPIIVIPPWCSKASSDLSLEQSKSFALCMW